MRRAKIVALGLLAFVSDGTAQDVGRDGYRTGLPAVLVPPRPPAPRPRPPESPFMTAYRRAGLPRMVLFFNRDIADTAAAPPVLRRTDTVTGGSQERLAGTSEAEVDLRAGTPESDRRTMDLSVKGSVEEQHRVEVTVAREATGSRKTQMAEAQQWLLESGFTSRLGNEGARLVDRATAMRLASTLRTDDPQQLETAALRGLAEIAVLIRAAPLDAAATHPDLLGLVFRVSAIDTRDGRILVDEVIQPKGSAEPAAGAQEVGESIAARLVSALIARWKPAPG